MKSIVVDTNIVFSAFLNLDSKIGQILLNGHSSFIFYAPEYIKTELLEHKEKIKKIGKLSDLVFDELYNMILSRLNIISNSSIPTEFYQSAFLVCKDIDLDDITFVAASKFLNANLWTGDLKLIKGLNAKDYKSIMTTKDMYFEYLIGYNISEN